MQPTLPRLRDGGRSRSGTCAHDRSARLSGHCTGVYWANEFLAWFSDKGEGDVTRKIVMLKLPRILAFIINRTPWLMLMSASAYSGEKASIPHFLKTLM